ELPLAADPGVKEGDSLFRKQAASRNYPPPIGDHPGRYPIVDRVGEGVDLLDPAGASPRPSTDFLPFPVHLVRSKDKDADADVFPLDNQAAEDGGLFVVRTPVGIAAADEDS